MLTISTKTKKVGFVMINNPVFGQIEFNGFFWEKDIDVRFCGKDCRITLTIAADENGEFEPSQYDAYIVLMEKWDNIHFSFLKPILVYYNKKRAELGYDKMPSEDYPEISTVEELLQHIEITGVSIAYAGTYGNRSVGITFDCTWDNENGIGVQLNDEQVLEVGYQDITI